MAACRRPWGGLRPAYNRFPRPPIIPFTRLLLLPDAAARRGPLLARPRCRNWCKMDIKQMALGEPDLDRPLGRKIRQWG